MGMEALLEAERAIAHELGYNVKFETKALKTRLVEATVMGQGILQQTTTAEFQRMFCGFLQKFDNKHSELRQRIYERESHYLRKMASQEENRAKQEKKVA